MTSSKKECENSVEFLLGFKSGWDSRDVEISLEAENTIYNNALSDIIEQIDCFEFDQKLDLIMVLKRLKKEL